MYIKRIVLNHFRNYDHLDIELDKNQIYIIGENGIGKTNILESIYYLTIGRSFRKADDKNLIQKGFQECSIYIEFYSESDNDIHHLSCVINQTSKVFAYDDVKVKSLSQILGKLIAIYYIPTLVYFFQDEPEGRRRLLDETCAQLSPKYLFAISRYKKLLKERNAAIQQNYDQDVIDAYRNELVNISYRIVKDRKDLVKQLSGLSNEYYHKLFDNEDDFHLTYKTNCSLDDDQETYIKNMLELFNRNQSLENIKKVTLIGPHRDDLIGVLNGAEIARSGSQGENRIGSLSLKIAIFDLISKTLNVKPLLLLDDVTSDLDERRCNNLLNTINNKTDQIFITGAKKPKQISDYKIYTCDGISLKEGEIQWVKKKRQ